MIICKVGNFSLRTKTFIKNHKYTTHDIEICQDETDCCFAIAYFKVNNDSIDLVSIDDRLENAMILDDNAAKELYKVISIGRSIMQTDETDSFYTINENIFK